jgi:hypothetical protein
MPRYRIAHVFALLATAACSGDAAEDRSPEAPRELTLIDPLASDAGLKPGFSQRISVLYTSNRGTALHGLPVLFTLVGDPKGSTLSADTVYTGRDGSATIQLNAGSAETSFAVHIDAAKAPTRVIYVEVGAVGFGSINATSAYDDTTSAHGGEILLVDYLLYEGMNCAQHAPYMPPEAARTLADSEPSTPTRFGALRVGQDRTLLSLGFDSEGHLRASGCVDLPADLIRAGSTINLEIVLSELTPMVAGDYEVRTELRFDGTDGPIAEALAPWKALGACVDAPIQRLLDCALDALDAGDPLDCSVEGASALTLTLIEERGVLGEDGCRDSQTASAKPSLETTLYTLMSEADRDGLLDTLDTTHARAVELLTHVRLQSQMSLDLTGQAGAQSLLSATHRLVRVSFVGADDSKIAFSAAEAAFPVPLSSPIAAVVEEGQKISFPRHLLGLNFGRLARRALADGVLTADGVPAAPTDLVQATVELVTAGGYAPGCPSLSALTCGRAAQPDDCLLAACEAGVAALAKQLVDGFIQLETSAPDLELAGQAYVLEASGDLVSKGFSGREGTGPAEWSEAKLRLGAERFEADALEATFVGTRLEP